MKAVSGQLGQPEASRGDQGVFVAYNSDAYCSYARGTAKFAPPALQPGMLSPVTANWSVPLNPNIRFDYSEAAADTTRLTAVLGDRAGSQSSGVHTGFIPNNAMPVLSDDPLQLGIPSPPMLSLADCMLGTTNPTAFADLPLFGFPRLAYAHFEDRRTVSGASLISAVAGASISSNNVFDIHLRIPLVIRPLQHAVEGGAHFDLGGPADGVEVPRSSSPLRLSFELEPILDAVVHSLHVDLYKLATGRLRHTRSYTITDVLQRELVLDGSVLEPGEYVFAISARRGTPRAVAGDFATVSYPQAVSRVFTRTFVVP